MANSNSLSPMSIKTSPAERSQIKKDAREAGMSLSSYARAILLKAPETRAVYRRTQTRRLMKELIGQIGRLNNNMNQIAWKLNSDTMLIPLDRKLHAEGIEALKHIRGLLVNQLLHPPGPC